MSRGSAIARRSVGPWCVAIRLSGFRAIHGGGAVTTGGDSERLLVRAADHRHLDVLVSGPKDAMAAVLHMGTPGGLVPLPPFLDPTRQGLCTVMYARPGYVGSTPQPGRVVADAAGDTAQVLDALGIDTFVTLGWSGGGPHALACAALLGERCLATAVVACDSPYPGEAWPENPFPLTSKEGDELVAALEAVRAEDLTVEAADTPGMFTCEWDRACLTGGVRIVACVVRAIGLGCGDRRFPR
jgi:pimeloyl-ACP methyl ester carboxylesterase